jgi:molybdopterin converting factor small subunit
VTVTCYGAMRDFLPPTATGNSVSLDLPDGATVGDVVDALGAPRRLVHAALVNEDPSDLSRELRTGDRLTLMPHYSGGRT